MRPSLHTSSSSPLSLPFPFFSCGRGPGSVTNEPTCNKTSERANEQMDERGGEIRTYVLSRTAGRISYEEVDRVVLLFFFFSLSSRGFSWVGGACG